MTAAGASPFPWDEVLHLALGQLRWTPETLWRATPREIAAALGPARDPAPLARAAFAALIEAFPDAATGSGAMGEG